MAEIVVSKQVSACTLYLAKIWQEMFFFFISVS